MRGHTAQAARPPSGEGGGHVGSPGPWLCPSCPWAPAGCFPPGPGQRRWTAELQGRRGRSDTASARNPEPQPVHTPRPHHRLAWTLPRASHGGLPHPPAPHLRARAPGSRGRPWSAASPGRGGQRLRGRPGPGLDPPWAWRGGRGGPFPASREPRRPASPRSSAHAPARTPTHPRPHPPAGSGRCLRALPAGKRSPWQARLPRRPPRIHTAASQRLVGVGAGLGTSRRSVRTGTVQAEGAGSWVCFPRRGPPRSRERCQAPCD